MTNTSERQIFLHGLLGKRQLREVLGSQLVTLFIRPEPIWLVSPWLSNFLLLDNRAGQWSGLEPDWTGREISFVELLSALVQKGCRLNLVTRELEENLKFLQVLKAKLPPGSPLKVTFTPDVHTKGLLTSVFFLEGSMNFTFSGANRNDELLTLKSSGDAISEALIEFKERYGATLEDAL